FTHGIQRIVKIIQACLPLPRLWKAILN
ncbi:MAG: CRISPR-associated helicase Cas3 family, partial [Rhodospirillaceae bacterium]